MNVAEMTDAELLALADVYFAEREEAQAHLEVVLTEMARRGIERE